MEEAFTENSHEQDNNNIQRINISYSGRSIVNWNIDGLSEQQILDTMKHMTMYASACKMVGNHDQEVAKAIVCGFTGWLREKVKTRLKNKNGGIIPYSVYTLGELSAEICAEGLALCTDMKLKKQLDKQKMTGKKELGDFLKIIEEEYNFQTLALVDSGADLNCINEGLVPSKYFDKTTQILNTADGSRLFIKYKLSNAMVCNNGHCFPIPFIMNPPKWTEEHTQAIKKIKIKAKELPCLNLANPNAFKIIECDASELGLGEILSIVHCATKFQSDILNTHFLIRTDCKTATDILTKDVQNLVSKQIFARWQAILSSFDFSIEHLKAYSKLQIRKVLSFEDWGSDPSKAKRVYSPDFPNKYYRHADYIDAWHKILTLQNPYNSHTWFLQFKMPINTPFPNWFRNWFATWGSLTQILPEPLQLSQNRFIDFNGSDPNIDYHLYFIAMYQVPWIVKWNFVISPNNTNNFEYMSCLGKQIAIKWWDVFVYHNIEPDNIQLKRIPLAYGSHSYSNPNSLAEYITIMKKQNPRATKEELEKQLLKIFEEEAETASTPSTPEIEIPLDTPDPSGHGMSQKHTLY
ncbi:hypothetical protein AMTRI_Chr09g37080 [Amborella trichopoda]